MSVRVFYILLIGAGVVLGLVLVRAAVRIRLVVSALLISGLALAGVFLPSLARAVVNDATAAAVFLVLLIWGAYDLVVRLPAARSALPDRPSAKPIRTPPLPKRTDDISESTEEQDDA
jgi:hypothetical protein